MARAALILSLAAFTLFNYGQYRGWSLFSDVADSQPLRPGAAARLYHK
ncbi:MAG: hypothetical protein K9K30_08600 [Burkholderiaceae bacterium]|nr:hypothetical protein [Sulfuritalea sp.]MCF8175283.1 hypothetical protein [Burkholderiaceae bacterium]MCF8184445.1 hypothetical protein [Polynucleobacter sp.]